MVALTEHPSDIAPHLAEEYRSLSVMTDDELLTAQTEAFAITEKNLIRLALIIRIREERGHDLSGIKIGLMRHLRRIADGKLLPEVVVRHAERPRIISRMGRLSIPEQRRSLETDVLPPPRSHDKVRARVEVDEVAACIIVTGIGVVITRDELVLYLSKLGGARRTFMCAACGESVGTDRPAKCPKCNGRSFEPESMMLMSA